ncbi:protocatechuate 3,4-dioxygenase subunit alpha [Streptomyces litchfieldiae]|uniref:Protocatechuate 3,4-dioxygenase subunit alpha n=1 Tax=Streptomyces litchfieldiae TaxID=3075543 RepID=A0ABU2MI59_9ACTN|nr:protocatechuate 3,4-dioxygenase subunit alpha [Streptomyces sp. DSM 44938]MDT0341267.1 protocatechuate 3,4-dioxygenase subunit alpha [Streptomyces sp. DSM 44938]
MTTADALLPPTPSQTVGPFYGYALPFPGGPDIAPAGHVGALTVHGVVLDGRGAPVPDALLEIWGPGPDGRVPATTGTFRRDETHGGFLGRHPGEFTGFGRVATDREGRWAVRTLRPGTRGSAAPYLGVCLFARGLLHHLFTRVYFPDDTTAHADDPLLASLPARRRATLIARAEPGSSYRFDIRLQGEDETVFLEFR